MRYFTAIFIALLTMASVSCQQTETGTTQNKFIQLDEKSAQLVEADNAFGFEIFKQIREESDGENLMISPLSISLALGMTYNGADGATKTEMEKVLKLNGLTTEEINNSYKMLISALQSIDKKVVFEIANAIYYADFFDVKPDFLNINKNYFDAEVKSLTFGNPAAVATINNWVAEKTHNKISKIIDNLSPNDRMLLLNAIYFNGTWAKEFNKDGTNMLDFYREDGSTEEVAMMKKEDKLKYATNSLFSAVQLPYGNGQYNMVVLLPENDNKPGDIIDVLTPENWGLWMESFEDKDRVAVTMPRFKFAFDSGLKNALRAMGMQKAFVSNVADFSKIADDKSLYISSVIHKSFIDVNETGTEAAAVTSVTVGVTSINPNEVEKIYFRVNKPFIFAITEKDTGAILFIGEVQKPEYES